MLSLTNSHTLLLALATQLFPTTHLSNNPTNSGSRAQLPCFGCRAVDHFILNCPIIKAAIKAGKCQRNHKEKVILSSGAAISWTLQEAMLIEQIDEWHF